MRASAIGQSAGVGEKEVNTPANKNALEIIWNAYM
jgi:hypothetical protein